LERVTRGRQVFLEAGCQSCHGGEHLTNSSLSEPLLTNGLEVLSTLRDVGTFNPKDALGQNGFDVPSLLGLHSSAPYLHDGSAEHLVDVLENPKHSKVMLNLAERTDLATFLKSLDGNH
jgi:cytochrome c peroxidase